jgi:CheY-like chemotaxis protein
MGPALAIMPASSCTGPGSPSRVLVVDDDPLIVASTAAILEDLGHEVIEASSASHALDTLRLDSNVDVVITDHAMPGMTGSELARQIRQTWPSLPVILATGYAELPNGEDPGLPRLSKPYRQEDLAAQIAQVVRVRAPASQRVA